MIGAIAGKIFQKKTDSLILMVGGVGYLIAVPLQLLSKVKQGEPLTLFTHTHVREDVLSLYGFEKQEGLELFELLLNVSGIGPKTALAIVNRGVDPVRRAVVGADVTFFTSIPRLGTKNAQKIIIELKTKLGSITELDLKQELAGETGELVEALTSMGFTRSESQTAIKQLPVDGSLQEKIKFALKLLGKQRT